MPLESLLKLVEVLRSRIDEHGGALKQSEMLTRYTLIDPLLRELGWNTDDPALVIPEYRSGAGSADYALLVDGKPMMMVEAKRLDTPLRDAVLSQGINYCLMEGTKHFTVTDGRRWEVYETHRPVPIDEKRIVSFDLKDQSPAVECLNALALWRPSVESGQAAVGRPPVVGPGPHKQNTIEPSRLPQGDAGGDLNDYDWHLLSEVTASTGKAPAEVNFPEGEPVDVKNWGATLVEVIRWLIDNGRLQAGDCPIVADSPRAFRHMVHTQPVHSNGVDFTYPIEVRGLWVERHDNRQALIDKIRAILKHVSEDPAHFKVRFPSASLARTDTRNSEPIG